MKRLENKKGYTLIEMMAVITIMAILASAAAGVYKGYVEKAKTAALYDTGRQIKEALLICEVEYMAKGGLDESVYWDEAFLKAPNHPNSILYPYVGEATEDCTGYTLKLGKDSDGDYQIKGFIYETNDYTVRWVRDEEITVTKK